MRGRPESSPSTRGGPSEHATTGARRETTLSVAARRDALVAWLLGDPADDAVAVPGSGRHHAPDCATGGRWSVQELVYALWDDTEAVPGELATLLGLPQPATFGAMVRLLHHGRLLHRSAVTFAEVVDGLRRGPRDHHLPPRIVPRT